MPSLHDAYPGPSPYKNVPVAVFGASGFIGGWVARYLFERGAHTYLFVRNRHAAQRKLSCYGLSGDYIELDILDFDAVSAVMQKIRPWITFNVAGYGVRREQRDEMVAKQVNSDFVDVLARISSEIRCGDWPGQDLIHLGSPLECGDVSGNLDEMDTVPNPQTVYGKSKLAGTRSLSRLCQATQLRGMTARLFTVYGPGEPEGRLLPTLLERAVSQQPMDLTAGQQFRDFTYVEDVAEGLLKLGLADGILGDVVNLATGRLTTVKKFTQTAADVLGISCDRLNFGAVPTRPEEMEHSAVTTNRLQELVDWIPETSIEDGIRRTMRFFQG